MLLFSVVACILCSVSGYKFPLPVPKCDVDDSKCLARVITDMFQLSVPGVPERAILPLDPLQQPLIEVDLADIKYTLTDSIITGLKDAIFNQVLLVYRKSMHFDITVPYYVIKGNYKVKGDVRNLHVEGEGTYFFNATDTHMLVDANLEYTKKDGNLYSKFTDIKCKTELLGAVHFDVDNLFDGNKPKANPILEFIKESPKAAAALWEGSVTESVLKVVFDGFDKMTKDVPISDIGNY